MFSFQNLDDKVQICLRQVSPLESRTQLFNRRTHAVQKVLPRGLPIFQGKLDVAGCSPSRCPGCDCLFALNVPLAPTLYSINQQPNAPTLGAISAEEHMRSLGYPEPSLEWQDEVMHLQAKVW